MSMFSFASDTINVFQLADALRRRGWRLQPQFTTPRSPRNLHVSVSYGVACNVDTLLADIATCVDEVRQMPPIDPEFVRSVVEALVQDSSPAVVEGLLAAIGIQPGALPQEMAPINEVLDALPDAVANAVVIEFVNNLY